MFSVQSALGKKSKTTLPSSLKSRIVSSTGPGDGSNHASSEDSLFKTLQFRSLTLNPSKLHKDESFYDWKNINDNYTKPIRFRNMNRPQTVASARAAFSQLTSRKRNTLMPCVSGKAAHRRFKAPAVPDRIFLTQGDRSREPSNVSFKAPSPSPVIKDELEDETLEPEKQKLDVDDIKRRLYQRECSKVGVTPVGKFLRSPTQSEISIRYYNLGCGGAKALSVPLMLDSTMTKLDLEGNAIGDEGIANMAEMLEEHCSINTMSLNRNNLTSKSASVLCNVLLHNRHLQSLSLAANNFDDKIGLIFAEMLKENRDLKHLDLSENSLGDRSGKALGEALSQNETLERLDLAWNKFRGKGAIKLLEGVKENIGLKWLNLSFNSLSRGSSKSSPDGLGNALANNATLLHVDLSSTQLHDLDMLGVAKGLKTNETLNTVKIGRNLIQVQTMSVVLKSIAMNESSEITLFDMKDMAIEQAALDDIEILRSRGVKVIHGPVHQTETNFLTKASTTSVKQNDDEIEGDDGTLSGEEIEDDD